MSARMELVLPKKSCSNPAHAVQGIYDTLKECACISKTAGGIGLSIHNIRAVGSYIRGTNGNSNGIVPMIRVFNDTARQARVATHCALHSPSLQLCQ